MARIRAQYWSIYGLRDSPDLEFPEPYVRYIGKSDDPYRRVKEHCVDALNQVLQYEDELDAVKALPGYGPPEVEPPADFTRWLAFHWREGKLPEVVTLETRYGDSALWRERERAWIATAKALGLELFNQTNGG